MSLRLKENIQIADLEGGSNDSLLSRKSLLYKMLKCQNKTNWSQNEINWSHNKTNWSQNNIK